MISLFVSNVFLTCVVVSRPLRQFVRFLETLGPISTVTNQHLTVTALGGFDRLILDFVHATCHC